MNSNTIIILTKVMQYSRWWYIRCYNCINNISCFPSPWEWERVVLLFLLSFQALQWTSTEGLQTTCAAALVMSLWHQTLTVQIGKKKIKCQKLRRKLRERSYINWDVPWFECCTRVHAGSTPPKDQAGLFSPDSQCMVITVAKQRQWILLQVHLQKSCYNFYFI